VRPQRAEVLSIGTELLLGEIIDTNSAYLAGRLASLAIDCFWLGTVGDNFARAREAIERALSRSDLLVTTGGLGPTEDDLTREAIAAVLGEEPHVDPELERALRAWFAERGMPMPERNRKQAWLIPSARPLANPLGTAPGWHVSKDSRQIVALPGVPREMTRMWEVEVEPQLAGAAVLRWRTLKLLGIGESAVEESLAELVRSASPTVATYAKSDGVHVRITAKGDDPAGVRADIARVEAQVRERVGDHIWGADTDTLPEIIRAGLDRRGWRVALLDGLTDGELAAALAPALGPLLAGALVRPRSSEDDLAQLEDRFTPDVRVRLPYGQSESVIRLHAPSGERRSTVRFSVPAEARRRGTLAALDLLRRALA
jgi:nicotinamide-nucleotide amidase